MFRAHAGFQLTEDSERSQAPLNAHSFKLAFKPRATPFASISSSMFSNLGKPGSKANTREEPATGLEYPANYCHKAKPCPELAGLGVRAKRLLGIKNINVYALGIYVDPSAAKHALGGKFKNASADDQALLDEVVNNSSFEKTLRLVISFGHLRRSQFLDALEERLAPSLKKAGEPATLEVFKKQFDDVAFARGLEISFVQEGSKLVTKIDGQQKGVISSPALCRSLFDIYLGKDAVAPDAKTTFGKSLSEALKH